MYNHAAAGVDASELPAGFYEDVGMTVCPDGVIRPLMARSRVVREYYDAEWGVPGRGRQVSERELFAFSCLLVFQAGLQWSMILRRRDVLQSAFAGFDPDELAGWFEHDAQRVKQTAGMIRNQRKIDAVLHNARVCVGLRSQQQDFVQLLYSHAPAAVSHPYIATSCPEADALGAALKAAGFRFLGARAAFAMMHRFGLVLDRVDRIALTDSAVGNVAA